MSNTTPSASVHARQQGMALIAAMLMLVVITLLGIAMFRSYGLEQRIGGNTRDKSRAFHAATAIQSTGEQWLTRDGGLNATTGSTCDGVTDGNSVGGMKVCSNLIQDDVQNVPWASHVTYQLPNMTVGSSATSIYGNYSDKPALYISFLNASPPGSGIYSSTYQVDAVGYGSSPSSIAVVESIYSVQHFKTTEAVGKGPPAKNVNLGGT